jgi:hypothetical protein
MSVRCLSSLRSPFAAVALSAALAAMLTMSKATLAADGDAFPYIAYVVEGETLVRSGPGRDHYGTAQLAAGHAVEVYRHDGAGWCAIRPPEGSFSLVPIQQLRVIDQRTAVIEGDAVPSRVGSLVAEKQNAVQVMLDRGEAVGLAEPPSPTSPMVRIAPPAGEFRWVAASRLSRVPPTEATSDSSTEPGWQRPPKPAGGALVAAARIATPEPRDGEPAVGDPFGHLRRASEAPSDAAEIAAVSVNPSWLPEAAGATLSTVEQAGPAENDIQIVAGSPAAVRQAQHLEATAAPPTAGAAAANGAAPPLLGGQPATRTGPPRIRFEGLSAVGAPLDPRVAEMQVRLSQIVVGPPTSWQFTSLREEAAALLAQDESPERREQLRDLLDRIATFETVQARYQNLAPAMQLAGAALPGGAAGTSAAANTLGTSDSSEVLARVRSDLAGDNGVTPTPGGPAPGAQAATEALYDAVGTLKPVVSRRQNAPQFALIDDHGDVVTFVTSSPDVNLQAYVGQRIGIRGTRGFMPEYRRAHVTASRVTALEERLVK